MFELEEVKGERAKIKVVGVGGAGGNMVNNMIAASLRQVEFVAMNTDAQALASRSPRESSSSGIT
jgi:cell division protein FtsZ